MTLLVISFSQLRFRLMRYVFIRNTEILDPIKRVGKRRVCL